MMAILERVVADRRVLLLISVFLKNGMMQKHRWIDKNRGVYQGDVLSPVLSNLYLHAFDTALENEGIDFVRFADDMIFLAHSPAEARSHFGKAARLIENLGLRFGEDKSYISCIDKKGFEFLGLRFRDGLVAMDNDRLMEKLSSLSQKTKRKDLADSIAFFNEYMVALRRYYLHALSEYSQLALIEEHIDTILIKKIIYAKERKIINKKSKFVQYLSELQSIDSSSAEQRKEHARALVARAYEARALSRPLETASRVIGKKKSSYLQDQAKSSEIVLAKYGLYASLSRGKLIVKEYGKVVRKTPLHWVSRIIVMTRGASLSTALIYECSKKKIDIDFIDRQEPYAQLVYYSSINNELHFRQLEIQNSKQGLAIAKSVIKAKMKNQINLLKYYARYREENDEGEFEFLGDIVLEIQTIFGRIGKASAVSVLMGYEGSASALYWRGVGRLIGDDDFKRETQNAADALNQAFNYAYAFIYHRVQSALIKTGLDIYRSFLHVPQKNKPTLVYDMVELFRQPVVDREIISIVNRGTEFHSSKGRLDKKSIKVITENIQERLATPTRWRKGKYMLSTIIEDQALELSHVVRGTKKKFKGFVARY